MRASELYIGRPDLMTPEELEEHNFVDVKAKVPMIPSWYRAKLLESLCCIPDEGGRAEFLKRKPALGFTLEELDLLREHVALLLPVQRRLLFRMLQNSLATNLICCSGARSTNELLLILENEIKSGQPSPIPPWYKFKGARERGFGYQVCSARGCFATESIDVRFGSCGGCRVAYYCVADCQKNDWKARHKSVCDEAKRIVGKEAEAEYFMKLIQDQNIRALIDLKK